MSNQDMKTVATPLEGIFIKRVYSDSVQTGDIRNDFQHDRDRILHSTAFRRLQYKTQVYMTHEGDLYRTRMTHTLEVSQIARGLAQYLEADPDLTEAIALAHDIGHTPFGHAGEEKLGQLLKQYCIPFNHNIQSYRVLSELEDRYIDFHGLNLTHAVYEGILRHSTYLDKKEEIKSSITDDINHDVKDYWDTNQPGIEAQIVNMADVIAYASHDIEDALANGLIVWDDFKERLIEKQVKFVYNLMANVENDVPESRSHKEWSSKIRPRILARYLINTLMQRVARQAQDSITKLPAKNGELHEQIRNLESEVVSLPQDFENQVKILIEEVLFNDVYKEPRVMIMV
ncbi:deoxyguanosinetriphosphate triphosphohydrolase family protein, partial [Chloroflexota bacterium]